MILQVLAAFVAITAFSAILYTSKRHVVFCGLAGAVGWFVYLALEPVGLGVVMRNFFAALAVAVLAHIFARVFKAPVTIFLATGILPMVPGAGMYQIAYQMFLGDHALASFYLIQTIQIAGVIALAIFLTDSGFRLFVGGGGQAGEADAKQGQEMAGRG